MPPRVTHRAPPTINLDLSAAFSRSSNAASGRAPASSCATPASATPSRAARGPGAASSSAAAGCAATPGLLARYPRIWELSGRTDGPAFPFTRRRTRQRAQKAFRPRLFDPQHTPLKRAQYPKSNKPHATPKATGNARGALSAALTYGIATPSSTHPVLTHAMLSGVELPNPSGETCGGSLIKAFTVPRAPRKVPILTEADAPLQPGSSGSHRRPLITAGFARAAVFRVARGRVHAWRG